MTFAQCIQKASHALRDGHDIEAEGWIEKASQESALGSPLPKAPDPPENRSTGDPVEPPVGERPALQSPEFCTWCLEREGTFTWTELPDARYRRCLCVSCHSAVTDAVIAVAQERRREPWEVEEFHE